MSNVIIYIFVLYSIRFTVFFFFIFSFVFGSVPYVKTILFSSYSFDFQWWLFYDYMLISWQIKPKKMSSLFISLCYVWCQSQCDNTHRDITLAFFVTNPFRENPLEYYHRSIESLTQFSYHFFCAHTHNIFQFGYRF